MPKSTRGQVHRKAEEWSALVDAWGRSGQSSNEFGRQHGVNPRTLIWWRSRLSRGAASPRGVVAGRPRLVRVDVSPVASPAVGVAWEVVTTRGALRIHGAIATEDLRVALEALVDERESR